MTRRTIAAMAAALLAEVNSSPVRLTIPPRQKRYLRILANVPTIKRAKVKAARKQAQKGRKK